MVMQLENSTWVEKYIHCVYWSVSTMVTILLYIPPSSIETIFSICAIFISTGIFGYALNTINGTLEDITRLEKSLKKETDSVNLFLKKNKIPSHLKTRV